MFDTSAGWYARIAGMNVLLHREQIEASQSAEMDTWKASVTSGMFYFGALRG